MIVSKRKRRIANPLQSAALFTPILSALEAIATGTTVRIARTSVAYVDFLKRTILACIVLTFFYATTDSGVDARRHFFTLHFEIPPFFV